MDLTMKRINAQVEATVLYTCYLDEKQSQQVFDYIGDSDMSIEDAISELYHHGELKLYANSTESDFSTNYVVQAEIEEGAS